MDRLKRAVDSIVLSVEAKERLLVRLTAVESPEKRRRKLRPGVLIATAVITALLVTGAGAACVSYFANRSVVPTGGRFEDAEFTNFGVIVEDDAPSSYSVEHAGAGWGEGTYAEECYSGTDGAVWNKLRNWDNDQYIAGSTRAGEYEWTDLEVIKGEGELLIRDVFDTSSGAVKREYLSFDPAQFAPYTADFFEIDYAAIEENYTHVNYPWLFYTISDKRGTVKGVTYSACYVAGDGANFTMEYYGDYWVKNLIVGQNFILEDEYDRVYTYTNASGAQFLIRAKDNVVAAECCFVVDEGRNYSSYARFDLHANFMTTSDVEVILDCIELH